MKPFIIGDRIVNDNNCPFVIAEVGINHEGDINKAIKMVDDAEKAGCECIKFQSHVVDDEMIPNDVVPGHVSETIWDIMERCALSEDEELKVKDYAESKGMIYLCTPFSRAAAERQERLGVQAYKIGSGECNNYPLIKHIAAYGKPVILSTGMNDLSSIEPAVKIFRDSKIPYALTHCTSMYPTPYNHVRLGALKIMKDKFPDAVIGLSDHSIGNYTCFAAVSLGANILEKHFTSDKSWPGPDVALSIDPNELKDLITGANAVYEARGGTKDILKEEKPTIDFAYACVVSTKAIKKGDVFTENNIWVKRPGTGEITAKYYEGVLGKTSESDIPENAQVKIEDVRSFVL